MALTPPFENEPAHHEKSAMPTRRNLLSAALTAPTIIGLGAVAARADVKISNQSPGWHRGGQTP
jgi:hypothetical protein